MSKYYPSEEQFQTVRIAWNSLGGRHSEHPSIDGVGLANVSRDYWNWRKDCPVSFKVIEQDLATGGSRRYPELRGSLTIEAKIRPEATISPIPDEVTILENGEQITPGGGLWVCDLNVANFSYETILMGMSICESEVLTIFLNSNSAI